MVSLDVKRGSFCRCAVFDTFDSVNGTSITTGADVPFSVERTSHAVDGGENVTYTFTIPENQEPGLMWYHQHYHGIVSYGYMSGQYGFFVIEGTDDDITKAPGVDGATEVFMMLSEYNPANASLAPSPPLPFLPIAMAFDWTALVNGQDGATTSYQFDQGELVLFRVAHAGVEPTYRVNIDNHTMTVIGYDGFPVPQPMQVETLELGTGQRVEFLVYFSTPGNYTMIRQPWNVGISGVEACLAVFGIPLPRCVSYDLEKVIANIEVLPSTTDNETMMMEDPMDDLELPPYNQYHQDLANKAPVDHKTILMQQKQGFPLFQIPHDGPFVPPGVGFGMNNRLATPFHVHGTVQAGTCETWDIISEPPSEHTFHIHASDFLVTHQDGVAVESPYWRDTLIVYENATIHVCFDRVVPGDHLLFHCHMPSHQDIGMSGFYSVVGQDTSTPPPASSPPKPAPPTPTTPTTPTPEGEPALEPTPEPIPEPSAAIKVGMVLMPGCVMFVVFLVSAW